MVRRCPSLVLMSSWCWQKSNSRSNSLPPCGMAPVVNPRGLAYSVTCHQWFTNGACDIRTLPTIWVHICSVSRVCAQSATRNRGQDCAVAVSAVLTSASSHLRSVMLRCRLAQVRNWQPRVLTIHKDPAIWPACHRLTAAATETRSRLWPGRAGEAGAGNYGCHDTSIGRMMPNRGPTTLRTQAVSVGDLARRCAVDHVDVLTRCFQPQPVMKRQITKAVRPHS